MKVRRILIIGYGAIASEVATSLAACTDKRYSIAVLLRPGSVSFARIPSSITTFKSLSQAAAFQPDLAVEAANHAAVASLVPKLLSQGIPVLVTSIGALHDARLFRRLTECAELAGARLILPSGALGALDHIRACRGADALKITYESRKPPSAWKAELEARGLDPSALMKPFTIFEGTADEAAAAYPQNLNVAAAIAIAGQGLDKIAVSVICDPRARGNTHTVTSTSALGRMQIELINQPSSDNPKTSRIVAQSIIAAISQYFSPIQML